MVYKSIWYCRWCGKNYKPIKDTDRDGFCCPACKQAHHRAYKLYIDWKSGARRKRTKRALRQKVRPKSAQPGTRHRRNAKNRNQKRRCDAKCRNAKGTECHCICGGVNHGVGSAVQGMNLRCQNTTIPQAVFSR